MRIKAEFPLDDENRNPTVDNKRDLSPEQCLKILGSISNPDIDFLGFDSSFTRPEYLIITVLPVAPPPVRPSVTMSSSMRQEDDLTHQYQQILKANNQLKNNLNTANHIILENAQLLQFYCATLLDNEQQGQMVARHKSGGKAIKAIRSRLKGKEGRLRGNLMGKRCDFSARTVITPDPTLDLDQLGVPRSIAQNVTIPEIVTPQNIDELRKTVHNGASNWPGAKYIIGEANRVVDLSYAKATETFIDYGYVIERHLRDGDFVLFNRQPSLHKMSLMGHRVKVLPYSTFRLNLSVTGPYNADFDGDEMNMFVPQNYETKAEVKEIMHVPKQIISPQSNSPVMGIVQDTLAGIMMFTYRDTFLELDMVMNLMMWIESFDYRIPPPAIFSPKPLWTGKQILSMILPKINLIKKREDTGGDDEFNCPKDALINIKRGELITGIICKKTVGTSHGGLIHIINNEAGAEEAKNFLSRAQRLVNNWLVNHSHTVGVQDTIAKEEVLKDIAIALTKAKEKVKIKLLKAQDGRLASQPGKDMLDTFETKVNKVLNDARNKAGRLARQSLDTHNKIILMVVAGSKGSDNNISQIMACVGQQNVEGKRIPFGFNRRTLPHFACDDFGPESRGFVENSYLRGLTPQEFYFHAMGGREGLIDTAVKTSETGYIQRRLVKALEDVMVKYDCTVRNSMEHIVQFIYGEDGIAGDKLEGMKIPLLELDDSKMKKRCYMNPANNDHDKEIAKDAMETKNFDDTVANPDVESVLNNEFKHIQFDRKRLREEIIKYNENQIHLPVNFERLIVRAKQDHNIGPNTRSNLHPFDVVEKVKKLVDSLKIITDKDTISKDVNENALILMRIACRFHL